MSVHDHTTRVPGCFRCDIGATELGIEIPDVTYTLQADEQTQIEIGPDPGHANRATLCLTKGAEYLFADLTAAQLRALSRLSLLAANDVDPEEPA